MSRTCFHLAPDKLFSDSLDPHPLHLPASFFYCLRRRLAASTLTMESFDTMGIPYLGSPLPLGNIQGSDYLNGITGMDLGDHHSNFETDTFVSGDDIAFASNGLPALKRFSSSYDDQFADIVPQFDPIPPEQPEQLEQVEQPPDSSIDHNNKLLSFSPPLYNFILLDYSLRRTSLSMGAQLHGMFFLAESSWTTSPTENPPPQHGAELTCYRRNLFQITGSVTLPRSLRYIMTDQGDRIPILAQELTLSATESVEGNSVKIISVPWKTSASANGNLPIEQEQHGLKIEKEPPTIPLDIMAGQDLDTDYATFPIAWKRLQFRVATANNGRRKELQQHFVIRLRVVATLSTGSKITICEVQSAPVIVRGRSPRNFSSRKDLPLSGSAAASRRHAAAAAVNRSSPTDSASRSNTAPAKVKPAVKSNCSETSGAVNPAPSQGASPDRTQIPRPAAAPLVTNAALGSAVQQISAPLTRSAEPQQRSGSISALIPLSLLDDEDGGNTSQSRKVNKRTTSSSNDITQKPFNDSDYPSPPAKLRKVRQGTSQTQPRSSLSSIPLLTTSSLQQPFASTLPFPNNESADLLYEYFPLGLDDWQAPVDAVYRPHVVHHTTSPEMKFVASRGRSKRYFAAEDVY